MKRVLYVNAMEYGANQGVDAIAHGLQHTLDQAGTEMRTIFADFRQENWQKAQADAVLAGIEASVDGIVVYVLDPNEPAEAIATARDKGIPVVTFTKPKIPVDGSVVYPNFNHGVFMMEFLASLLPSGARVGVIGGPPVTDDIELILGIRHGLEISGLQLVNDPDDPRYKNESDVASGGYEKAMNLLEDFDRLDGLVPFNDETLLGTLDALREKGRLGEAKMVSRNGTPKAVEAILDELHDGTWDLDCPGIGAAAGDLMARVLVGGEDLDGLMVASPIGRIIDRDRAKRWVPWSERIPYNPLISLDD
jgi:ABC-type sugar transport system substrate-binding protein